MSKPSHIVSHPFDVNKLSLRNNVIPTFSNVSLVLLTRSQRQVTDIICLVKMFDT